MSINQQIIAGDTLNFTTAVTDYPASDGWTLTHRLIPRTAGTPIELTSAADDEDPDLHRTQATAAVTALWAAGDYSWVAYAVKALERYTVAQGAIEILADPGEAAALDLRTHARKMLEAIETWLESRNPAVAEYEIAGRRMKYTPVADLIVLRDRYRREVRGEDDAARISAGLGARNKLQVRI
jgi:hypothetical protein